MNTIEHQQALGRVHRQPSSEIVFFTIASGGIGEDQQETLSDHDVMYKAFINVGIYSLPNVRQYHYNYNIVTLPVNARMNHHPFAMQATAKTRRRAAARLRMQWNRWLKKVYGTDSLRYQYNRIP